MRASYIRLSLFAALCLFVITNLSTISEAQTISPAPTAAGFPFFSTNFDSEKITRGNDGAVWFAGQSGLIGRLSLTGSFKSFRVEPMDAPNGGAGLWAIYWGVDNNVWFGTFAGVVGKLNPSTGAVARFQLPEQPVRDITRGPDGNMWAVAGASVYRISPTGVFTKFLINGHDSGSMLRPGPDGKMWIIETFGRRIFRMNTSGLLLQTFTLVDPHQPACGPTCAAITAGPDGNMWFTQNEQFPQIGRITMSGQITYFPIQGTGAGDIAWVHDGGIWFADPQDLRVDRINPATGVITYFEPIGPATPFSLFRCISSASDGELYYTAINENSSTPNQTGVGKIPLWVPENTVGTNIYPTHGTLFSGTVAGFSDFETINGTFFKATIHWGDGASTTGTVTRVVNGSPSEFKVHGSHTYANKGKFNVTINVNEPGDQYKFVMTAQASVQ